jgi:uncharacterized protein
MPELVWLIPLGIAIGALGTLMGVGGGIVLVPLLLILYPHERPEVLTAVSLTVIFFNALSGSVAYARMRRIDYRAALIFAASALPGAILGAICTEFVPRREFNGAIGVMLMAAAVFLTLHPVRERLAKTARRSGSGAGLADKGHGDAVAFGPADAGTSAPVDAGTSAPSAPPPYRTRGRLALGAALSTGVGFLASLLGLGGGIIHVPVLVTILKFPVHVATATSHMILAILALAAVTVHVADGSLAVGVWHAVALAAGVVVGAQVGAALSNRISGLWIMRALTVALGLVGLRILILAAVPS